MITCRAYAGWVALALAIGLAGCNAGPFGGSTSLFDHQSDQPYAANGRRARMDISLRWDFVNMNEAAAWKHGRTNRSVTDVVQACDDILPRNGWIALENEDQYAYEPNAFNDTRVIVCVDPIVAISVPVPDTLPPNAELIEPDAAAAWIKLAGARVNLPSGYRYGTRIPYHREVTAILPDDGHYLLLVPDADGNVRIPVPWGAIELTPSRDQWKANALRTVPAYPS